MANTLKPQSQLILILSTILGLAWIFVIPPFQMPDEPAHYIKSCANPLVDRSGKQYGHYYDSSLEELAKLSPPGNKEKFSFIQFFETNIYDTKERNFFPDALPNTVVAYTAPSLTCHLFSSLETSKQLAFYAMRVATCLLFLYILLLAARIDQEFFIATSPMLMIPMVINQSVAIGADSFSIAACMLAAAVITALTKKSNVSTTITATSLFLLLNTKTTYLVFALPLLLAILKNGSLSNIKGFLAHTTAAALALILQLYFLLRKTNAPSTQQNASEKVNALIDNPVQFLQFLDGTISRKFWIYIQTTIGKVGWLDTPISYFGYYAFIASAAITALLLITPNDCTRRARQIITIALFGAAIYLIIESPMIGLALSAAGFAVFISIKKSNWHERLIQLTLIASILASIFLVFLSMHVFWGSVGMRFIEGVQGRYFLPLIPFLVALLYLHRDFLPSWKTKALGGIFLFNMAITMSYLIQTVIPRFHSF